jgi:hypothetical protein
MWSEGREYICHDDVLSQAAKCVVEIALGFSQLLRASSNS